MWLPRNIYKTPIGHKFNMLQTFLLTLTLAFSKNGQICYNDKCYIHYYNKVSYPDAELICRTLGGNLAVIQNEKTNKFIVDNFYRPYNKYIYIGINNRLQELHFMNTYGEEQNYFSWGSGQPDNSGGNEHCVHMYHANGEWNDINCNTKMSFICEFKKPNVCYNGMCYTMITEERLSQSKASKYCIDIGGKLAEIESSQKNKFIVDAFLNGKQTSSFYFGMSNIYGGKTYYNSYNKKQKYFNFGSEFSFKDGKNCGIISEDGGKWEMNSCEKKLPFLCEKTKPSLECEEY